eukprot:1381940-Amorphochlora_amoeboformis.AAC.1
MDIKFPGRGPPGGAEIRRLRVIKVSAHAEISIYFSVFFLSLRSQLHVTLVFLTSFPGEKAGDFCGCPNDRADAETFGHTSEFLARYVVVDVGALAAPGTNLCRAYFCVEKGV